METTGRSPRATDIATSMELLREPVRLAHFAPVRMLFPEVLCGVFWRLRACCAL